MGFLVDCNKYLIVHNRVFAVFLYAVLTAILLMFVIALVHVYRGTKYTLVLFIAASVIVDVICYMVYCYYNIT